MSAEQILLAGLTAVTTALVVLWGLLWQRSEKCEADRISLRLEIEDIKSKHGKATGELGMFERCQSQSCPFKPQGQVDLYISPHHPPHLKP